MASKGKKSFIGLFTIGIGLFAFFGVFMFSCDTDNAIVNLALKKEGKVYLFSKMGSFIVENSLAKNESPSAFPFIQIFEDDGLFVAPKNVEEISNLMAGNFNCYPYLEKSCDGYVTAGESKLFKSTFKTVTTEQIGEQVRENTIEIINPNTDQVLRIIWEWNQTSNEYNPIENCEVKSFWIETSVQPGETVASSEDFIMVNLNTLVEFYNNEIELNFEMEEQILYVTYN